MKRDVKRENQLNISRRDFLKTSALIGTAGAITLSGCQPKNSMTSAQGTDVGTGNYPSDKKWDFENPPQSIPANKIIETLQADVVVLGAGLAGVCAAMAAAEKGAKVIVLEKREVSTFHGGWCGVVGSRRQKELGIDIDADEVIADMMRWGAYMPDQRLLKLWADESGRVMDRLLDMADAEGIETIPEPDLKQSWLYKEYDISLRFLPAWNATLVPLIEKNAKAAGAEFLYETPAVQLLREEENGRVVGVIAENLDGYLRIDAKAVIICTGGYENNPEMLAKYAPRALHAASSWYSEGSTTGDGIKMGMWVGGAMQAGGYCPMLFDGGIPGFPLPIGLARQPWLNVNTLGKRYVNEDAPFGYTCNQDINQPGHMKWSVWDAKWEDEVELMHGTVCERLVPPLWSADVLDQSLKAGFIVQADTLEELATIMEVPLDTFLQTVQRYNELAKSGKDLDFGKNSEMLTTIEQAPFFATKSGAALVVTLDGLQIDTNMQVLGTEGKQIPGLYAAGNASGNFFANDYPITAIGVSHGRALTFGWLAGENAVQNLA
ncbi:MAG: FAD-binding dehydrogenase [Chloroflexi bacterium HGW-Chloroflexi-10]|nr:MAG: FAD-binding dehydrogenase [Chloroflexi bacterium HGW-Chloroflexi-10]